MTETSWTLLETAHTAIRTVVTGVDDWSLPTPCEGWSVAQVVHHAAGDQQAYAAFITGEGGPDFNPFDPAGVSGATAVDLLDRALTASAAAFATIAPDTAEVSVPIPPNKLSASDAVGAAALDAAVHAWDVAVATGQPSPLTPDLAAELLPVAQALVEPLRGFAFGPALPPHADDDEAAVLLRYLGRTPA